MQKENLCCDNRSNTIEARENFIPYKLFTNTRKTVYIRKEDVRIAYVRKEDVRIVYVRKEDI